jgi:hypothetical protein
MEKKSNMGHNSESFDIPNLHTGIAGLKEANEALRSRVRGTYESLIIVARWLVYVEAAVGHPDLADKAIRADVSLMPSDLISSITERGAAKWLARGGLKTDNYLIVQKNPNEINDLSAGNLNSLEAKVGTKRYAKATTWGGIYNLVIKECRAEIRKALNGETGAPTLDDVRKAYSDVLFKAETVDGWIADEEYRRTDEYARIQELKKAWAMRIDEEVEIARREGKPEVIRGLEAHVVKQVRILRAAAVQAEAEKAAKAVAKENAAKLTSAQKRTLAAATRNEQEGEEPMEYSDDDDNA